MNVTVLETEEDIKWLIDVHHVPTNIRFAILYGNEDAPDRIECWSMEDPTVDIKPNLVLYYDGYPK